MVKNASFLGLFEKMSVISAKKRPWIKRNDFDHFSRSWMADWEHEPQRTALSRDWDQKNLKIIQAGTPKLNVTFTEWLF